MIKVFQHGNDKDTVIKLEGSNQVIALEMTILIRQVTEQFPEIMEAVAKAVAKAHTNKEV